MKPVETPHTNSTLVGAEGDENVHPLPAYVGEAETISQWELDDEDRQKISEGGQIALGVAANPTPPVGLTVVGRYCPTCNAQMGWSERFETYFCPHAEDDPTPGVS